MALLIAPDGQLTPATPRDGRHFTWAELLALVGGYIQPITIATDYRLLCDEDGRPKGLPANPLATEVAGQFVNGPFLGTVLIASTWELPDHRDLHASPRQPPPEVVGIAALRQAAWAFYLERTAVPPPLNFRPYDFVIDTTQESAPAVPTMEDAWRQEAERHFRAASTALLGTTHRHFNSAKYEVYCHIIGELVSKPPHTLEQIIASVRAGKQRCTDCTTPRSRPWALGQQEAEQEVIAYFIRLFAPHPTKEDHADAP